MSAIAARLRRKLANFAAYAYRTLVLFFIVFSLLTLSGGDGGWINWAIVSLILSSPFAAVLLFRRLRRGNPAPGAGAGA